jgi:hypothetical protein
LRDKRQWSELLLLDGVDQHQQQPLLVLGWIVVPVRCAAVSSPTVVYTERTVRAVQGVLLQWLAHHRGLPCNLSPLQLRIIRDRADAALSVASTRAESN